METAARLHHADPILFPATRWQRADLADEAQRAGIVDWWESLTSAGGEGMVVKPLDFIARGSRGIAQPAVKCRGREYLRIIYGPEYDAAENLDRLRQRGLGHKRSMAEREFALGLQALEHFTKRRPLREVHQCVLGVLALESEPVDPRL
jgi:protein phosphatase